MRPTTLLATLLFALLSSASLAQAHNTKSKVVTATVEHTVGDITFKSFVARPVGLAEGDTRPAVLVVHEWWGLNEFAKQQARDLAAAGYIALAVDMYGSGVNTQDPKQAGEWAGQLYNDRPLYRERVNEGLNQLVQQPNVDRDRLAAIGFCFGGTAVCELALSGAPVKAVVSFHGNPKPPLEGDIDRTTALIAIHHGDVDPLVPDDKLNAFLNPLREAGKDFLLVRYANAVHSFTNPAADAVGMDAVKYDATAAKLAFAAMHDLFDVMLKSE